MPGITNKSQLFVLFFLAIVLADMATKIIGVFNPAPSAAIKALILLIIIPQVLYIQKEIQYLFLLLFFLFSIGCISHSFTHLISQLPQFFEYYFFLFFFLFFYSIDWKKIKKPVECVFLAHSSIIIVAAVMEITFFKTYPYTDRFGYMSLFNSQNEFSFVLMSGVLFFYNNVKDKPSHFNVFKLVIFFMSGLLVGTKAYLLFAVFFLIYICIRRLSKLWNFLVLFSFVSFLFLFSSEIIGFVKHHYYDLYKLYMDRGFLSLISSTRSDLFIERGIDYLNSNSIWNIFFGGGLINSPFEMSIFDLLTFLGILGTVGYLILIYKKIVLKIELDRDTKILVIIIISISLFSGYLLENASAQIYLLLVMMSFGHKVALDGKKEEMIE